MLATHTDKVIHLTLFWSMISIAFQLNATRPKCKHTHTTHAHTGIRYIHIHVHIIMHVLNWYNYVHYII